MLQKAIRVILDFYRDACDDVYERAPFFKQDLIFCGGHGDAFCDVLKQQEIMELPLLLLVLVRQQQLL